MSIDIVDVERNFILAIEDQDTKEIIDLCKKHSFLISDNLSNGKTSGIAEAAWTGNIDVIDTMINLGFSINAATLPEMTTVIISAIHNDHFDMIKPLLERGANPKLGRPMISVLNARTTSDKRIELMTLLLDHGVDVNALYPLYGDWNNAFTALDHARTNSPEAEFLKSRGGKSVSEAKDTLHAHPPKATPTRSDDLIRFFGERFGPVDPRTQNEIVPSGLPIAIHSISPSGTRNHITLFTSGLSSQPMEVPKGKEEYAFAELFIELPGNINFQNPKDMSEAWPSVWMRKIAEYQHSSGGSFGGPAAIIPNGSPSKPLAKGLPFVSWLALAEFDFVSSDGKMIQLYRLLPLHQAEQEYEKKYGIPALIREFDRRSVPFIVDLKRLSAV